MLIKAYQGLQMFRAFKTHTSPKFDQQISSSKILLCPFYGPGPGPSSGSSGMDNCLQKLLDAIPIWQWNCWMPHMILWQWVMTTTMSQQCWWFSSVLWSGRLTHFGHTSHMPCQKWKVVFVEVMLSAANLIAICETGNGFAEGSSVWPQPDKNWETLS